MDREIKTAEEIRANIQAMIDDARQGDLCNVRCAPMPVRRESPDHYGCNWTFTTKLTCPQECMVRFVGLLTRAQELYNLG